jgi:hypothetical protein
LLGGCNKATDKPAEPEAPTAPIAPVKPAARDAVVSGGQQDKPSLPSASVGTAASASVSADGVATVSIGVVARLKKDGQVQKTWSSGLRSEFSGFPSLNRPDQ